MHIKDYARAEGWFRKHAAAPSSKGAWKAFVARNNRTQEPRTMAQEPRNMYAGGQLVRNTVDGSRPGYGDDVAYKTEKWLEDPGFKKFYKNEKKGTSNWDAKQRYDVLQAR